MSAVEMIYAATIGISLISVTVFLTVIWEKAERTYKTRKRAKLQRVNARAIRHRQFEKNTSAYSEVLK